MCSTEVVRIHKIKYETYKKGYTSCLQNVNYKTFIFSISFTVANCLDLDLNGLRPGVASGMLETYTSPQKTF